MGVNRDEFFAELDRLTEREIEAQLPKWDMERLTLAQEYVESRLPQPARTSDAVETEDIQSAKAIALVAVQTSRRANLRAVAALILSIGAMLAAVLSGVMVVLR
jgi:hypothetical protein